MTIACIFICSACIPKLRIAIVSLLLVTNAGSTAYMCVSLIQQEYICKGCRKRGKPASAEVRARNKAKSNQYFKTVKGNNTLVLARWMNDAHLLLNSASSSSSAADGAKTEKTEEKSHLLTELIQEAANFFIQNSPEAEVSLLSRHNDYHSAAEQVVAHPASFF
jgi:hypothetical protein